MIDIIHESADLIVVNKPTGLSVTRDRSGAADLPSVLREQMGLSPREELRLVHRLDKDTSGVLVIARNLPTQSRLSSCFEKGFVEKTYLAIVSGAATAKSGAVTAGIAPARGEKNKMQLVRRGGKKAETRWRLLAEWGGFSLLAVEPVTGRTHQIRVHLPGAGLPLAVDPLYGGSEGIYLSQVKGSYRPGRRPERPLIDRLTLHAYQLRIPEGEGAGKTTFVAPLDEKFLAAVKMLSKHNRRGLESLESQEAYERIVRGEELEIQISCEE